MQTEDTRALSRRAFVGRVTRGAAGTALALTATASVGPSAALQREAELASNDDADRAEPIAALDPAAGVTETAPAPWGLLQPLAAGSTVATGWKLADLSGVHSGSSVLTLENASGRQHRVHICRNQGDPQGLVFTDRFDLVVMNGGMGDLPTEESFGRAVAEIAHIIAGNEAGQSDVAQELLTQSERLAQYTTAARLR